MGLFKRKKNKRTEEINLNINLDNDDFLFESIEKKDLLNNNEDMSHGLVSSEQLTKEIINTFATIVNKNNRVVKEYYICKIFSRVGLKDLDFNLQVVTMDKHVNRLKKDCFDLSRIVDNIKIGLQLEYNELSKLHKQIMDLKAFQMGLLEQLNEINNGSYGHLKISTVSVTINKSNEELENLYNNIASELKDFKTFEEASEYIFYNSGEYIGNIIDCYIKCIEKTNNKEYISIYDKKYFLPSDVVISLEIKEWIELYNKLKFVLKLMSKYENKLYQSCYTYFKAFEAKYAILMMRAERKRK